MPWRLKPLVAAAPAVDRAWKTRICLLKVWLYKRNNKYYAVFAGMGRGGKPIYSGRQPNGPLEIRGKIMENQKPTATNHGGIIDYRDNLTLPHRFVAGGGSYGRATAVEPFTFNADGTIPALSISRRPQTIRHPESYKRVEGNHNLVGKMSRAQNERLAFVNQIRKGGYIKVANGFRRQNPHPSSASGCRAGRRHFGSPTRQCKKVRKWPPSNYQKGGWDQFKLFKAPVEGR